MFRKKEDTITAPSPQERITSILGEGLTYHGRLTGSGGVRIEGVYDGEIEFNGLVVVGNTGRVTCENIQAKTVIVAGAVKGSITAEKVEIRSTGRVWGDVATAAFATEEGAFLRGQIRMEEEITLNIPTEEEKAEETAPQKDKGEKAAKKTKASKSKKKS